MHGARLGRRAALTLGWASLGLFSLGSAACPGSASNQGSSPPPASAAAALTPSSGGLDKAGAPIEPAVGAAGGGAGAAGAPVAAALSLPIGAEVVIQGLYLGWEGPCTGAPPTKSAWQLADDQAVGSGCIYVDGPLQSGLARKAAAGAPGRVRVTGVIREEGKLRYLQSAKVEPQ